VIPLRTDEAEVLGRVLRWSESVATVRVVILESSRAIPSAPRDALTDYDISFLVTDPATWQAPGDWVRALGEPLLRVRDVVEVDGLPVQNDMLLFADGAKIDCSFWPVEIAARIAARGTLPPEWDHGYRVLLDKDGFTERWPQPTGDAYRPVPPASGEFRAAVEEFWWLCTYVAKNLWRGELLTARVLFEYEFRHLILLRFAVWRIGIDSGWTARPGFFGRGVPALMGGALWEEWRASEQSLGTADEMWTALWHTIELFRVLAIGIAADLALAYPADLDARMVSYLRGIQRLPRAQ
jgi:aminoglycoside 6-adenylyltransferase